MSQESTGTDDGNFTKGGLGFRLHDVEGSHGTGLNPFFIILEQLQGEIPVALLFFNVGVEIGQLLFVGVVLAAMALLRRVMAAGGLDWPRWAGLVPVYVIGTVGAYWVIERVAAMGA